MLKTTVATQLKLFANNEGHLYMVFNFAKNIFLTCVTYKDVKIQKFQNDFLSVFFSRKFYSIFLIEFAIWLIKLWLQKNFWIFESLKGLLYLKIILKITIIKYKIILESIEKWLLNYFLKYRKIRLKWYFFQWLLLNSYF